jgi:hypothetical protein
VSKFSQANRQLIIQWFQFHFSSHLHTKKRSENSTIQKTTIHSTNSNRIMLIFGMIEHNNIIIINTREKLRE